MSNYRYYFINAAKIDFSNLRRTKIPLSRKEIVIKFGYLPLKNWLSPKKKKNFMSRTVLSDPKMTSPVSFSNFQTKEFFLFQYFGCLDETRAAVATRLVD